MKKLLIIILFLLFGCGDNDNITCSNGIQYRVHKTEKSPGFYVVNSEPVLDYNGNPRMCSK